MSEISDWANALGIPPNGVSTTLQFCKTSKFDTVWHIFDWTEGDDKGLFAPLHDCRVKILPVVKADSLTQLSFKESNQILLCVGCVEEFMLAKDLIDKNPRTVFKVRGGKTGLIIEG